MHETFNFKSHDISLMYKIRLLGRFAPIFYVNCEHVLIANIEKQKRKKFRGFKKKINADFQDLKILRK